MASLAMFLLGTPRLERDGVPLQFDTRKIIALGAYVALSSGAVSRDGLMALLWPELESTRAQAVLRRDLSLLNKALGGEWLVVDRQTIATDPAADFWLDVAQFRHLINAARGHGHAADEVCPRCLAELEEAVALYRGDFLEGLTLRDSVAFDDWQFFQAEALRQELSVALERLVRGHLAQGSPQAALPHARRRLALDPLHEPAHRQLMALYAHLGQRSAALRQYRECVRLLDEELGVAPDAETTALYEQIRRGGGLPDWEILPPGPRAATAAHNLPAQATPLIGREQELADVRARLQDPTCRLLTLLGPGGVGKTRLALQAAANLLQDGAFKHGVFFCSLAPIPSAQGVVPAVAEALGVQFRTDEDRPQATPRQQLLDYMRRKQLLLVMDNYEHLLAAGDEPAGEDAPEGEAVSLIVDIMAAASGVKLLVTSRAGLRIQGEHLYPVQGLVVPPGPLARMGARPTAPAAGPAMRDYSAVELFMQGARQARPDFELRERDLEAVAHICRLVEGLPLGILLAAAWVQVLPPAAIAAEIEHSLDFLAADRRDVPLRQRSIRAIFDHSWRLLDERERDIFQGLAVFRGSFTHHAALAVTGASLHDLLSLVNKSFLLPAQAGRYELHELLHQYAAGRLDAAPAEHRAALYGRHCTYYCAALERFAAGLKGSRQRETIDEMDLDIENARIAWVCAVADGHVEHIAQAVDGMALYHTWRLRYEEGEAALRAAVERLEAIAAGDAGVRRLWAKCLAVLGDFWVELDRPGPAEEAIRHALDLLDETEAAGHDGHPERALALFNLARLKRYYHPDPLVAYTLYEHSLAVYQDAGDRWGMARSLAYLGRTAELVGQFRQAQTLCEQSLALFQELGDRRGMADAMLNLGVIAWVQGRLDHAQSLLEQSAGIFRDLDDWGRLAQTVKSLGEVVERRGQFDDGLILLESSAQIFDELGLGSWVGTLLPFMAEARLHLGHYAEALADAQQGVTFARQGQYAWALAFSQLMLGLAILAQGQAGQALALFQEAAAAFESIRHRENQGWVEGPLGLAAHLANQLDLARQGVRQALEIGVEMGAFMPLLYALPVAARLLADRGAVEHAAEVYACAARSKFVANSCWFQDMVGTPLDAALARLPGDVGQAAQARGQAQEWEAMARQVLGEL